MRSRGMVLVPPRTLRVRKQASRFFHQLTPFSSAARGRSGEVFAFPSILSYHYFVILSNLLYYVNHLHFI